MRWESLRNQEEQSRPSERKRDANYTIGKSNFGGATPGHWIFIPATKFRKSGSLALVPGVCKLTLIRSFQIQATPNHKIAQSLTCEIPSTVDTGALTIAKARVGMLTFSRTYLHHKHDANAARLILECLDGIEACSGSRHLAAQKSYSSHEFPRQSHNPALRAKKQHDANMPTNSHLQKPFRLTRDPTNVMQS